MTVSQLETARALPLPTREAMLQREPSVQHFWLQNRQLLVDAWQEWEAAEGLILVDFGDSLMDDKLRHAVMQTWQQPELELAVADLLEEVAPGVYQIQFFNPQRLHELRKYMDKTTEAGIPTRPPYGIALNRGGAMLDPRSEGYLAAPGFQQLYRMIIDIYMRPIARMLFPEIVGFDSQSFGFSILYQAGVDTSLRPHTDASAVTLNMNLNMPEETYTGSNVDFYDGATGATHSVTFKPGAATIHRGSVPHAAQPITSGQRANLVFWLYGDNGRMPPQVASRVEIDAQQRWLTPDTKPDLWAPF